jgi:hypothetical protein
VSTHFLAPSLRQSNHCSVFVNSLIHPDLLGIRQNTLSNYENGQIVPTCGNASQAEGIFRQEHRLDRHWGGERSTSLTPPFLPR